jgi:hypothetical protein
MLTPLMGKLSRARSVWMPYQAPVGTGRCPGKSCSILQVDASA